MTNQQNEKPDLRITDQEYDALSKGYFHLENIKGMIYKKERMPRKILIFAFFTLSWVLLFVMAFHHLGFFPYLQILMGLITAFIGYKALKISIYL